MHVYNMESIKIKYSTIINKIIRKKQQQECTLTSYPIQVRGTLVVGENLSPVILNDV